MPVRHAHLERKHALEVLDLVWRKNYVERLDVCLKLLDLAPAHNGEHVRCLLHHVRDRDCLNILCTDLSRHFLESLTDRALLFSPLPVWVQYRAAYSRAKSVMRCIERHDGPIRAQRSPFSPV